VQHLKRQNQGWLTVVSKEIFNKLFSAVCAIGLRRVDIEQHKREILSPHFEIVGTGFAIDSEHVLTNRHVLESVRALMASNDYPDDSFMVQFITVEGSEFTVNYCEAGDAGLCSAEDEDVGFIKVRALGSHVDRAVTFGAADEIYPGQPLAILGYADGTKLQQANFGRVFDEEISRFGPVLQQGYLSAVAPMHGCASPKRLLLDIRTTGGLSGAPVFLPNTGDVIGIHFASNKTTTAFSLPLDNSRVQQYKENFKASLAALTA
jgi:hypothetical protein